MESETSQRHLLVLRVMAIVAAVFLLLSAFILFRAWRVERLLDRLAGPGAEEAVDEFGLWGTYATGRLRAGIIDWDAQRRERAMAAIMPLASDPTSRTVRALMADQDATVSAVAGLAMVGHGRDEGLAAAIAGLGGPAWLRARTARVIATHQVALGHIHLYRPLVEALMETVRDGGPYVEAVTWALAMLTAGGDPIGRLEPREIREAKRAAWLVWWDSEKGLDETELARRSVDRAMAREDSRALLSGPVRLLYLRKPDPDAALDGPGAGGLVAMLRERWQKERDTWRPSVR